MAKKTFNLETELTAKIDDLTTKLNRANTQVETFKKKQAKSSTDIESIFKGVSKSFGYITAGIIAAQGVLASFDKVINSTQATGDAFALTMGEINNTISFLSGSLAQMDFSNF
ncbi:hypothetical protein [Gaoshiqia sediminis]|uniref:Uncharacterized protein n=1 Tax=Gaoshiqia sediminis TaxID=2986998 RepID=A0AA41Y748_9BACT|nr:hypothetical protein [Gaoshiqia sediminis]MCW0484656.1 hypothetical protein [Gaoshiqia sediminis]